jgi:uncharacterized Tic20 family protein
MEEGNSNNEQKIICGLNENVFVGLMNLALVFNNIGWVISIVLWGVGKDKSEFVKKQGENILNWIISWVIYGLILLFLGVGRVFMPLVIGIHGNSFGFDFFKSFLIVIAIAIFLFICPIIGALKGFKGKTWRYPLAIRFLR